MSRKPIWAVGAVAAAAAVGLAAGAASPAPSRSTPSGSSAVTELSSSSVSQHVGALKSPRGLPRLRKAVEAKPSQAAATPLPVIRPPSSYLVTPPAQQQPQAGVATPDPTPKPQPKPKSKLPGGAFTVSGST